MRKKYNVSDFRALYTFYYCGFNLRSTDLQAYIGLLQMKKLDDLVKKRSKNFEIYNNNISDKIWKIKPPKDSFVSNMGYPIILEKIDKLVIELQLNNIECRPLICGSMNEQPFWFEKYPKSNLPNAKKVHNYGLYLPNNPNLSEENIIRISNIINQFK